MLHVIVAGSPDQLTGGYLYDRRIVRALHAQGRIVHVRGLAGRFPHADAIARAALQQALAALPDGSPVLIDGLALGGLPDVAALHARRLRLIALVHHPLADETGLDADLRAAFLDSERAALQQVAHVIATSHWTARRLADFGVSGERLSVVEPGVDARPVSPADGDPPRLLCVATVTPRKGHDVLVEALAALQHLPWHCLCVGSVERDPVHALEVSRRIGRLGLASRVQLAGERAPRAVHTAYAEADIFVLPSHYEGFGMVVTEALACGLPVVTTTGGALADTLPREAGLAVPPGDAAALADALHAVLTDGALRRRLREGARAARERLQDWTAAGAAFARVLDAVQSRAERAA
ncbi:glycosyltransferase family 4 protein [Methyloversatilis thermotolerans]|uniref:glycosyltransferase family 4 protein n=1 Tax=Methyloversatilis thermotolerans TaxID=1346290 RepID=UPI00058BF808|nr:glycosyltransferase family 4 protein [Methyloversatilis thermotolerans]